MKKYQNSFSVFKLLIVGSITSFLSFTQTALKPTSAGTRLLQPFGSRMVQRALILKSTDLLQNALA
jgi:hypothetical protein